MTKFKIYSEVAARCLILLILFILLPVFFTVYIFTQISELYISGLSSFIADTKLRLASFEQQLKSKQ